MGLAKKLEVDQSSFSGQDTGLFSSSLSFLSVAFGLGRIGCFCPGRIERDKNIGLGGFIQFNLLWGKLVIFKKFRGQNIIFKKYWVKIEKYENTILYSKFYIFHVDY